MQIAQIIGGYTLGGADLLRRAMGKKKPEEMAQAPRDLRRRARAKNGLTRAQGRRALRPDGEVRGLRLQQVARRGLRAGRLPDRVPEGASPGGVHGGEPVGGDGRHRQGAAASSTTRVAERARDAAAGHQRSATTASCRSTRRRSATGWARSRAPAKSAIDRIVEARAQRRPVHAISSISASASTSASSTGASVEALVRAGAFDAIDDHRAQPARLGRHRARGGGAGEPRRSR